MIDADSITVEQLRAQGSFKWTAPGPDGFGAAVAEMDFGVAGSVLDALAELSARHRLGYLSQPLEDELGAATAGWADRSFGWTIDPSAVHPVGDVLQAFGVAISRFSRAGSPVILPTPAYMPFLEVPHEFGRQILQVPMRDDGGTYRFDLAGLDAAFRAGGDLLVLCNPYNPLGRVFDADELGELTTVVDRHGGRVFADEIHAPLVYPGRRHVPYASTSETAAGHAITAVSASKAWNLAGLKCAEVVLTNDRDRDTWSRVGLTVTHSAGIPGVVATIAAFRDGDAWRREVLEYLDGNRRLLADLLAEHAPGVRYRPPEGTYLAWLDCTDLPLAGSPGELVTRESGVLVVDGPAFGAGGPGSLRFNFATPRPVLRDMVVRMTAVLGR